MTKSGQRSATKRSTPASPARRYGRISGVTRPMRSMTGRREKYAMAPMSLTASVAERGRCASTQRPRCTCMALMFCTPQAYRSTAGASVTSATARYTTRTSHAARAWPSQGPSATASIKRPTGSRWIEYRPSWNPGPRYGASTAMASGCASSTRPTTPSARPRQRHARTIAGSARGSSGCVRASHASQSRPNASGRSSHVTRAGSRRPMSRPSSPPSTFAAAVDGNGVPVVAQQNATNGSSAATTMAANSASRLGVGRRASARNGSRTTASGRASVASPPATAVSTRWSRASASSAAATSRAASVTSIPDSAPQANGPLHTSPTAATSAAGGEAPQASAARRSTSAAISAPATPSVLAMTSEAPATRAPAASSSVQSGAVEPATGTPGL